MKNITQKIISTILVLALIAGCFAALPLLNAAPAPAAGTPAWDAKYSSVAEGNQLEGEYYDRGNASGDKISSNAHSGDYPGVYFRWDDKQKMPGVFLVEDWVFDLFVGETFFLTAKNSNSYYKYEISRTGVQIDGVWVYGIPKAVMAKDNKGNDKKDELKNINMVFIDGQYKSAWVLLMKAWFDEDGKLIWKPFENCKLNEELKFSGGFKLGVNEYDFGEVKITDFVTASKGKKVTITELDMPKGYAFQKAYTVQQSGIQKFTNCKDVANGVELTLKPNDKAAVLFENQKQKAEITVLKVWFNANSERICAPEGVDATFTIDDVVVDLGKVNKRNEGSYTVAESAVKGFDLISIAVNGVIISDDDIANLATTIDVVAGGKYTVTFTNKAKNPFTLLKTIEGTTFEADFRGYTMAQILEGITFTLYEAKEAGVSVETRLGGVTGDVDADGFITFDANAVTTMLRHRDTVVGWYEIVESYASGSLAEKLFEEAEPFYVYFDGTNIFCDAEGFDYGAFYTIVNGHGGGYVLNYQGEPKLNNSGDIFPIAVKNAETGEVYPSYCANGGSVSFFEGDGSYMVALKNQLPPGAAPYEDFIKAYNYIEVEFGNLDDNRAITQIVTWYLLGAIAYPSAEFKNIDWDAVEAGGSVVKGIDGAQDKVEEVIANYATYSKSGNIVEVVLMVGINGADYYNAQPQLVPLYGGQHVFNNKLKTEFDVSFTKTKYGGLLDVADGEFGFDLFKIVDGVKQSDPIGTYYTNAYGEVTAKLAPGSYVFREVWTTVFDGGLGYDDEDNPVENYNLVWKAIYPDDRDGLYFTISTQGAILWDNEKNVGVVDNEIYGKHTVLWAPDGYDPVALTLPCEDVISLGDGNGKIIIMKYDGATMTFVDKVDPTCQALGILWLGCSDGTGVGIVFGELCAHDHVPLAIVSDGEHDGWVWFGGQNGCVCGGMEKDIGAWYALGGYEFEP